MRFFLIIISWIVIIGGLRLYTWQRDMAVKPIQNVVAQQQQESKASYRLQITSTFSVEPDPFALEESESLESALQISLNGQPIKLPIEQLKRGEMIQMDDLQGVIAGHNEIYVKASPPVEENLLNHGIRINLIEGGNSLVDQTLWSEQGSLVSGTVVFKAGSDAKEDHEH